MVWPRAAVIPRHRPAPPIQTTQSTRPTQAKRTGPEQVTCRPPAIRGRPHEQASRAGHGQATRAGQPPSGVSHPGRSAAIRGKPPGQVSRHQGQATRAGQPCRSRAGHPAQATRKGWPYYIRCIRAACGAIVYSRATPCGWPARGPCASPACGPCGWPVPLACSCGLWMRRWSTCNPMHMLARVASYG